MDTNTINIDNDDIIVSNNDDIIAVNNNNNNNENNERVRHSFSSFSTELLFIIISYFSKNYTKTSLRNLKYRERNDLHTFFLIEKSLKEFKNNTYIYEFNQEYSLKYLYDNEFRSTINTRIENKSKRLCLNITYHHFENDQLINNLSDVYKLNLSGSTGFTDVSSLDNLDTLILTGCHEVTDVSSLAGLRKLSLAGCNRASNIHTLGDNNNNNNNNNNNHHHHHHYYYYE